MQWQAVILVLIGCVFHAIYGVVNKHLVTKKIPANCIGTVNYLGGGALLLAIAMMFSPPRIDSWFDWPMGLLWPLTVTCLFNIIIGFGQIHMMKYADASLVEPVSATQPMVVLIPSWLVLGEIPGAYGYVGLYMMALGMYVFFATEVKGVTTPAWLAQRIKSEALALNIAKALAPFKEFSRNKGVRIAFVVALCGAVSVNFDKLAAQRSSPIFAAAFIVLFIGVYGLIKSMHASEWKQVTREHIPQLLINPIVYATILVFYWSAFNFGFAAYVGALKRLQVLFVLLLSWLFLKEMSVKRRWPGAIIMTLGAMAIALD